MATLSAHPGSMFENLEPRRFLSINVANGVLTINGSAGNDVIEVQRRASTGQIGIRENAREVLLSLARVTKIVINGGSGHDLITYSSRDGGLSMPGTLTGGNGNDSMLGGFGRDTIAGGAGHDHLKGAANHDRLAGDAGNDILEGNDGNDRLEGGSGNDDLFGQAGVDHLSGGSDQDDLFGGSGADSLFGNSGNDDFSNSDLFTEVKDRNVADNGTNANP